jgi:hypothetical protein
MESYSKLYGAKIIACERTREAVSNQYHIREIDMIVKKNDLEPTAIYEIMAASGGEHNHDMMSVIDLFI